MSTNKTLFQFKFVTQEVSTHASYPGWWIVPFLIVRNTVPREITFEALGTESALLKARESLPKPQYRFQSRMLGSSSEACLERSGEKGFYRLFQLFHYEIQSSPKGKAQWYRVGEEGVIAPNMHGAIRQFLLPMHKYQSLKPLTLKNVLFDPNPRSTIIELVGCGSSHLDYCIQQTFPVVT